MIRRRTGLEFQHEINLKICEVLDKLTANNSNYSASLVTSLTVLNMLVEIQKSEFNQKDDVK